MFPALEGPVSPALYLVFETSFAILIEAEVHVLSTFKLFGVQVTSSANLVDSLVPPNATVFGTVF